MLKHKAKVLTKEEVEANRSNAYKYIDFNKMTKVIKYKQ